MIDILLFEMLLFSSMLFSFWQILFTVDTPWQFHLLFAVILVISILAAYFGRKNKRYLWLILLMLPVMLLIDQTVLRWSVPVIALVVWRYLVDFPAPYDEADYADKLLFMFFGMVVLVILRDNTSYFVGESSRLPTYLPVFFLSGIFFLRSLRHRRTGQSQARIRRTNAIYLGLIGVTYLLSQFAPVRNSIRDVGYTVISWIMAPINYVIENIVSWWFKGDLPVETGEVVASGEATVATGEAGVETAIGEASLGGSLAGSLFVTVVVLFALIFFYRVFIKRLQFSRPVEVSDDVREQMSEITPKKRRLRRERYPDQPAEQVRYYYRRFLEKLGDRRDPSDTTRELDDIAKTEHLESEELSRVYRMVRYGNQPVDEKVVEQMKQHYRKMNEKK